MKNKLIGAALALTFAFGIVSLQPVSGQLSLADTIVNTALKEYNAGHYRESLRMYKQVRDMGESGKFPPAAMEIIYLGLAENLRSMGEFKEAEKVFNQAIAASESLPAAQRRNLALIYNDLSLLYQDQGRFTEAEALMKQSDGMQQGNFLATNNLARLYYVWGKADEMKPCLDKAEKLAKKGKKTLALTFWQFNKGNYATLKGQYKEAEAAYKEGLESCNTLYGNTHLYYTIIMSGLADLYRLESRYNEAEQTLREVVKLRQKTFSNEHPETAGAMVQLAAVLCDEGKYADAEKLASQAVKAEEILFGDTDNLFVARARHCLGNIQRQDGHYEEAANYLNKALLTEQRILGREHVEVAEIMDDLAKVRADQANFKESETLLTEAQQIAEHSTGPDHPRRAVFTRDLGHLYLREGKYGEAEPLFKAALALSTRVLGETHSVTADSARDLGDIYLKQKKYAEAIPYLQKALSIDEQLYGAMAPQLAGDLTALANAQDAQGNSAEAGPLLKRAAELKSKLPGAAASAQPMSETPLAFNSANDRPVRDKWALSIGISNFKDSSINLKYAAKDATDFKNFLVTKENFKADHVRLLTDEQATRENIIGNLGDKWLAKVAHPDDLVVIYVSSHGSRAQDDANGVNFMVAHDTDKNSLLATGIPMQWLTKMVKDQVPSNRVVLILDVCHSGSAAQGGKALIRIPGMVDLTKVAIGSGQMMLCSSLAEQVSWESKNYENSVFTRRLMEALQTNQDKTTLLEAFKQLKVLVETEVIRDRANLQTPVLWNKEWQGSDPRLAVQTTH